MDLESLLMDMSKCNLYAVVMNGQYFNRKPTFLDDHLPVSICVQEGILDNGAQHEGVGDDDNDGSRTIAQYPKPFFVETSATESKFINVSRFTVVVVHLDVITLRCPKSG
jgi:hypothetical protein